MASTPTVYVICDQNCKFEGMTKEQIYAAIVQAVNEGTIGDINTGFVQTIKTINGIGLKFFVGTQAEYDRLSNEDKENLFAIITDDATKDGIIAALNNLDDKIDDLTEKLGSGAFVVENAQHSTNADEAQKATKDSEGNIIARTYGNFFKVWQSSSLLANTVNLNGEGTYLFTVYVKDAYAEFRASALVYFWGNAEMVSIINYVPLNAERTVVYRIKITASGVASVQRSSRTESAFIDYTDVTNNALSGYIININYKKIL